MITRQRRLLIDSVLLGVVGAISARVFVFLLSWSQRFFLGWIGRYQPPALAIDSGLSGVVTAAHGLWWIPLSTTLGGLLAGMIVYLWAPEAEGHGTDAAVQAFHHLKGIIRSRVPFIKLIASAITIGSGGSAGREGPTALISAGIASIYAKKTHRTEQEARLLLLIGMAAGLSAIFRSPIGTAIFAVEVLYSEVEFESRALIFTLLGSIVAYAVNGLFVGFRPLFAVPATLSPPGASDYGWYAVLGIACGVIGTVLPMALYGVRDLFRKIPCPPHCKPAIAGCMVGLVAVAFPQLLGGGYSWIQAAIDGNLPATLLFCLVFGKILTFALTIGSGGSGGVFAPSLFTGAMLGGFLSPIFHQPPAAFAVVGMAAVFASAARVPIATLLMVTSMTGGYHLLVAAALAVLLSYLVQSLLSSHLKYKSLYEAQVPRRSDSPSHYLEQVRIALEMTRRPGFAASLDGQALGLIELLNSGVPINVIEGKQMRIGALRPDSPCVGQKIESACLGQSQDVEIILILRGNTVFWPKSAPKLQGGDRVIAVTSEAAWAQLSEQFEQGGSAGHPASRASHETHTPARETTLP
ncbi:MAG TPA: chloride channel protein [Bryobacteraceae bacterium]|nr:chloride channel protein [Bryobacteraceae bacterium]